LPEIEKVAAKTPDSTPSRQTVLWQIGRDTAIVVVAAATLALGVNMLRDNGIPLVQQEAYNILVPCPEAVGDAEQIPADDSRVLDERSLVLDVRLESDFKAWHLPGAENQPFDWLGPPVDKEVSEVAMKIAASGAHRVIVYGDGDDPDSGREWARLLSGARIKHVFYVQGGGPALSALSAKEESP